MDLPVTDTHIMPGFHHYLLGIGKLCDEDCTVLFTKHSVQLFTPDGDNILIGWRDPSIPRLWSFSLLPQNSDAHWGAPITTSTISDAFSAYKITSAEALVRFYHAPDGFPVKSTCLHNIKAGNYTSCTGLTAANATKYCPKSIETKKGHMTQTRQGLRSTKPKYSKPTPTPPLEEPLPPVASNKVHICVENIKKLYTENMGHLPIRSCSSNQYIMLTHHCNINTILFKPFKSKKDLHPT